MLRWRTKILHGGAVRKRFGPARPARLDLRLKWRREPLAETVTDGGQAMKGLALLVDTSLLLALPTATA